MEPQDTALIIVDVQRDFCPGGALATARGNEVAEKIAVIQGGYSTVVATQDWHIDPAGHFSPEPDYADTWPVHCVAETKGSELHPALAPVDAHCRKGEYSAAYSGFEGNCAGTPLEEWLRGRGIAKLDIVGIATDHCVQATANDALRAGFDVRVLRELCSAVDEKRGDAAL